MLGILDSDSADVRVMAGVKRAEEPAATSRRRPSLPLFLPSLHKFPGYGLRLLVERGAGVKGKEYSRNERDEVRAKTKLRNEWNLRPRTEHSNSNSHPHCKKLSRETGKEILVESATELKSSSCVSYGRSTKEAPKAEREGRWLHAAKEVLPPESARQSLLRS